MRVVVVALLLVAFSLAAPAQTRRSRPAPPSSQAGIQQDQKAITDLQQRDIEANIALDTDKLMALRTDDIVYLVPGRQPLVGQEAVRKYLDEIRQQLADWDMTAYEENWQEVQVFGDLAYEWGTINIRAQQGGQRRESSAVRNVMQTLKRQPGGDWKIARVIWNIQEPQAPPPPAKPEPPKSGPKPSEAPGAQSTW